MSCIFTKLQNIKKSIAGAAISPVNLNLMSTDTHVMSCVLSDIPSQINRSLSNPNINSGLRRLTLKHPQAPTDLFIIDIL